MCELLLSCSFCVCLIVVIYIVINTEVRAREFSFSLLENGRIFSVLVEVVDWGSNPREEISWYRLVIFLLAQDKQNLRSIKIKKINQWFITLVLFVDNNTIDRFSVTFRQIKFFGLFVTQQNKANMNIKTIAG